MRLRWCAILCVTCDHASAMVCSCVCDKYSSFSPLATLKYRLVRSHKKQRPLITTHIKPHVKIVPLRFYVLALHLPLQRPATRNPLASSVRILRNILIILPNFHILRRQPPLGPAKQIKYPHRTQPYI